MEISFDEAKRQKTLAERGLDFLDSVHVFADVHFDVPDDRFDYGEPRIATFGLLGGRMITLVWTPRGAARRIISMRYANDRERARFKKHLDRP